MLVSIQFTKCGMQWVVQCMSNWIDGARCRDGYAVLF